jgi:hypothetical protein
MYTGTGVVQGYRGASVVQGYRCTSVVHVCMGTGVMEGYRCTTGVQDRAHEYYRSSSVLRDIGVQQLYRRTDVQE